MNLTKTFTLGAMLGMFPVMANAQSQKHIIRITMQYYENGKQQTKVLYDQHDTFERTAQNTEEKPKNKSKVTTTKTTNKSQDFSVSTSVKKTVKLSENLKNAVPDIGTSDPEILKNAPNPSITIAGKSKKAVIVVDISTNILYKYDRNGKPEIAYRIASGRKNMPTQRGVRIVTHKEKYPYRGASRNSKRRRTPRAFGPYIICLNKIDTQTGEQSSTGQFIHGTNEPNTPKNGMYVSHGCMRMNNDVITKLKDQVNKGDIVIIK